MIHQARDAPTWKYPSVYELVRRMKELESSSGSCLQAFDYAAAAQPRGTGSVDAPASHRVFDLSELTHIKAILTTARDITLESLPPEEGARAWGAWWGYLVQGLATTPYLACKANYGVGKTRVHELRRLVDPYILRALDRHDARSLTWKG